MINIGSGPSFIRWEPKADCIWNHRRHDIKLCNYRVCNLEKPLGYAMDAPVFSWTVEDAAGEPAWASLTVNVGGETVYQSGEIPEARTRYDYTLTVRSTGGDQASADAFFEAGCARIPPRDSGAEAGPAPGACPGGAGDGGRPFRQRLAL